MTAFVNKRKRVVVSGAENNSVNFYLTTVKDLDGRGTRTTDSSWDLKNEAPIGLNVKLFFTIELKSTWAMLGGNSDSKRGPLWLR